MYLFDNDTGEEIEHEPKYTWKNLDPGETYTATLDSEWWYGAMPYHDWNLRIEVRKQSTPYVAGQEPAVKTAGLRARARNASLDYPSRR